MNKDKLFYILQCVFMATIGCIAVIFVIKYTFEIDMVNNLKQNETTKTQTEKPTKKNDETEMPTNTKNDKEDNTTSYDASNETSSDEEDTNEPDTEVFVPLEDRTYLVKGETFTNEDILSPCYYYNHAIARNDYRLLSHCYPDFILEYTLKLSDAKDLTEYIDEIHANYINNFGDLFNFKTTLSSTKVLNKDEIHDMELFYETVYNKEMLIDAAILVETVCQISYVDENLDKKDTDSETEYFISYYYEGKWYIDYIYTDYSFFN